jgi:hypothetical protein
MELKRGLILCLAAAVLGGCATIPAGPSVMVLPKPGKSFEAFQSDDAACRQWAAQQIQVPPNETVNKNLASGAAVGTVMGAAAPLWQAAQLTPPGGRHSDDMTMPISNACMRRATRSPDPRSLHLSGVVGYPLHRLQATPRVPPLRAVPETLLLFPRLSKSSENGDVL